MKLNILSDLHLSAAPFALPHNDADVVVLAGDVARPWEAVAWAAGFDKPVLYVPGNHEFYGDTLDGTIRRLREACAGTQVRVLDDDEVVLGGVRFLGSTLWTDFRLFGDGDRRAAAMRDGQRWIRDFTRIRVADAAEALFTPERSAALFDGHARWLAGRLAAPHPGPTVVITHHAPSPASIHPRFAGSPLNACFISDAEHLLDGTRARLWIHGHTHDSFDYVVNGTRVICNPRGYARDGIDENPLFDPDLVVEIV
ncbi:MAG TPA: metallophosphoesterase [Casimicrobiaceae bacterium]|nr:metallophosphoesterase [Casimicrobiaceae bacterium]